MLTEFCAKDFNIKFYPNEIMLFAKDILYCIYTFMHTAAINIASIVFLF